MNAAAKLTAYVATLALVVTGAYAIGSAVGPLTSTPAAAEGAPHGEAHSGDVPESTPELPGGLASSRDGYTLTVPAPIHTTGPFTFQIIGPDGTPVTAFDLQHEKRLHLIVVRRDTTGFQHVHPAMAPDGTWSIPLDLPAGGSYRMLADFAPTGAEGLTLGADLAVPGTFEPVTHQPSRTSTVDGYEVTLTGELSPGSSSPVTLTVRKDGVPVPDLQPYLGAMGHLVALREGDLAYLHVHPKDGPPGSEIKFVAEVPTAATYRLFLDFKHGDVVRTAEFTVPTGAAVPDAVQGGHADDGHGH